MSNLSSKLSYELPSHPISEHHEALLSKTNTLFQLINLKLLGIDFLPEIIIFGDCRYRYAGVRYGRGIYRQEDEVPPTESPFFQSVYTLLGYQQRFPHGQCYCVTTFHTPEDAIASGKTVLYGSVTADPRCSVCHGTGAMPAEPISASALMHSIDLKQYTFSSFLTADQHLDLVKIISPDKRSIVFVAEIGEDKPIVGCIATPKDMKDFLSLYPEIRITREEEYTAFPKTRVGIVSRKDYGYVKEGSLVEVELGHRPPRMHNDLHNPAYMQCERCRVLAEKLAEMLENPPGFKGIKVDGEHYGNKYIDYGWQEAVRVVQSLIVPCDDGTIPETSSSLVENSDVPQEKQ